MQLVSKLDTVLKGYEGRIIMQNSLKWEDSIYSEGSDMFVSIRNPKLGDTVKISIRLFKDSPVKCIYLRYTRNGEERLEIMELAKTKGRFKYYSAELLINQPIIKYHFIICSDEKTYFYNQAGAFNYVINEENDFKIVADFNDPGWPEDAMFYLIFVDRFFNGNKKNDIKTGEYKYRGFVATKREWDEKPGKYEEYGSIDFFGGDLEGVKEKIPYLKELGINAIYLNPIFDGATNHKYDCNDYMQVARHYGGDKALVELVEELHKENMKIVLDISINHTGDLCKWIKEKPEFYFLRPDGELERWSGSNNLCTLNYSNNDLIDIIYKFEDSVLKHWLNAPFKIDGWRFDVGQSVGKMNKIQEDKKIWKEIRKELKNVNENAYLFTENMYDCREYLQGDMWDGSMNYMGFLRPVREYLGEFDFTLSWRMGNCEDLLKNGIIFKNEVINYHAGIPYQVQRNCFNNIGTHDIHRIHTSKFISEANALTAMVMLMTFKGVPCIYYGDEIGLSGEMGPLEFARYPMDWNEKNWNKKINDAYKNMIKLRNKRKVLKNGCFTMLMAEKHAISYARFNEKEAIIFVNSQYDEERVVEIPVGYIGHVTKLGFLYGENDSCEFDNDKVKIKLKPEETVLLDLKLK